MTQLPISFRVASLAPGQLHDYTGTKAVILEDQIASKQKLNTEQKHTVWLLPGTPFTNMI